ncbi:MAG: transglycosylase SLT domain-containing protein [Bdellovibrionales bacterium]|nr:transglycosylase SLT domain-containing protein [Bdellovibrionales bacterium]
MSISRCHPVFFGWSACVMLGLGAAVTPGVQAAEEDNPAAKVAQARAYEHGEGVPKDLAKAAALYCDSARQGDAEGMYALGWMYANGRGLERRDDFAATLFAMAAFLGHSHAARMSRYTGEYTGVVPECLNAPEQVAEGWNVRRFVEDQPMARRKLVELVAGLAAEYQVDPRLALAIATIESNFNPTAVSTKSAMGVMQLIPETAERFNVRNPFDPVENVRGGLAYLRWLLAYFKGDVALAAAGYNAGEGAVDRYKGVPPYRETRGYVDRILSFFAHRYHPYDSRVVAPSRVIDFPTLTEH